MKKHLFFIAAFFVFTSLKAQTFKQNYTWDTTVISAFHQGNNEDYNCASIAIIKCAIATFGINDVFKKIQSNEKGFEVTLRNNEIISITKQELDSATKKSGFIKDDNQLIFNKANFIYAIMAKRAVTFSDDDYTFAKCDNFDNALDVLHDGFNVQCLPILIGMAGVKVKAKSKLSYVHANGYHAVFASKTVFDNYGSPDELNFANWKRHLGKNPILDIESINFILVDRIQEEKLQKLFTF